MAQELKDLNVRIPIKDIFINVILYADGSMSLPKTILI